MSMHEVTRCHKTNSAPNLQFGWYHQFPVLHNLWQEIQADYLPLASTALANDTLHPAFSTEEVVQFALQEVTVF